MPPVKPPVADPQPRRRRTPAPPVPPYAVVRNSLPEDAFRRVLPRPAGGPRRSAMDDPLDALKAAPRGHVLRFPDKTIYKRLRDRAKTRGMTLHFAEQKGALLVQLVDTDS